MSALDLDALERRAHKGLVLSPDETLALITRLRAAEARTAWQPIETAPRDGTLVLAWHPWWMGPDAVRCGRSGVWTADGHPVCEPTHWMPLPAAPEAGHG